MDVPSRELMPPPASNPRAVSLRLVILFVTCCAVVLGLIWHWPGPLPVVGGIALVVVVRTWSMLQASDIAAGAVGWKSWGQSLLGSVIVMSLAVTTSAAAFLAVSFPLQATPFHYQHGSAVPLLGRIAWFLGGIAASAVAALSLDALWLRPLSERWRNGPLPTARERVRSFFSTVTPLLSALVIGGMCSLMPPALTIASGSQSSRLHSYAVFAACLAAFAGGGWVGYQAAKRSELPMAALLGVIVGLLPATAAVLAFQFLWNGMQLTLQGLSPPLDSLLLWGGAFVAAITTLLAWRWSRKPD